MLCGVSDVWPHFPCSLTSNDTDSGNWKKYGIHFQKTNYIKKMKIKQHFKWSINNNANHNILLNVLIGNEIHTFKVYYKNDVYYAHVKCIILQVFEWLTLDLIKRVYIQTVMVCYCESVIRIIHAYLMYGFIVASRSLESSFWGGVV